MFFTWLGLLLTPILGVISVYMPRRLQHMDIFGFYAGQAPQALILTVIVAMFALFVGSIVFLKAIKSVSYLFKNHRSPAAVA